MCIQKCTWYKKYNKNPHSRFQQQRPWVLVNSHRVSRACTLCINNDKRGYLLNASGLEFSWFSHRVFRVCTLCINNDKKGYLLDTSGLEFSAFLKSCQAFRFLQLLLARLALRLFASCVGQASPATLTGVSGGDSCIYCQAL